MNVEICNEKHIIPVQKRRVLNIGGGSKAIPLPECFDGWLHDLLDIDPRGNPDVICDARELLKLPPRQYDAVYCSHNLEHYYQHDVCSVLRGMRIVLTKSGFAYIRVPDLQQVMTHVVENGLDIDDVLYIAPCGPILVSDVMYGYHKEIELSGQEFYAHKTGFTEKSLRNRIVHSGFSYIYTWCANFEVGAIAFKVKNQETQLQMQRII